MSGKTKIVLGIIGTLGVLGFMGSSNNPSSTTQAVQSSQPTLEIVITPTDSPQEPIELPTIGEQPTPIPTVYTPVPPQNACAGASALCSDGSCSYSAHRQGTCSHHGGVAIWNP
ncbi:MAG TPA: DUF3761 domain-containing protein [Candidatus Saccharimonadales bacterium]|nr:DUF3761 domain-containing protein [Candidatus Saccharimonadales bacterium]